MHWPLPDRLDLRDRLLAAYAEDGRGYHDVQHLREVLDRIEELGALEDADIVLAAWFHDAVYDGRPDAEERSALLAEDEVGSSEVARLVRLTAHHRPADGDTSGEILCDADLAILAADADRYTAYVAGVRTEYAHVSDADFAIGRAAILEDLLAKPTLFHTRYARTHWEDAARANVAAEIAHLRATS